MRRSARGLLELVHLESGERQDRGRLRLVGRIQGRGELELHEGSMKIAGLGQMGGIRAGRHKDSVGVFLGLELCFFQDLSVLQPD